MSEQPAASRCVRDKKRVAARAHEEKERRASAASRFSKLLPSGGSISGDR